MYNDTSQGQGLFLSNWSKVGEEYKCSHANCDELGACHTNPKHVQAVFQLLKMVSEQYGFKCSHIKDPVATVYTVI